LFFTSSDEQTNKNVIGISQKKDKPKKIERAKIIERPKKTSCGCNK
jgi:hypothetical protein